jgi:hypothetical protein
MDIGTHSLRRGLASDWALLGVPDRLRMVHGRWRSAIVADGYVEESVHIHQCLNVFQSNNAASASSVSTFTAQATSHSLSESIGHPVHMMDHQHSQLITPSPNLSSTHLVMVPQLAATSSRRFPRTILRPHRFSD